VQNTVRNRTIAVLATTAAAVGATLVGAPAQAAATTTIQVRPADLIAPSDTADGGVMEFLAQGVHLKTTNSSGYARGRFPVGVPLSQVTTVDYTWYGTTFEPGVKYYIDADADGKIDGELRGELAYLGKDVWLNQDAQDFPDSALADNFFADHAPCTDGTAATGADGPCGSSGASKHGTLADWAKLLQAATGKAPVLVDGGYSLAGGAGDGVLTQVTYGPNQYTFTNVAKSKVRATAEAKRATVHKKQKVKIIGSADPAGAGAKLTLQVKDKGKWTDVKTRVLAASGDFKLGAKPVKVGVNRFRVLVGETNSTQAATTNVVKVKVLR
jgi:hypothetical protein